MTIRVSPSAENVPGVSGQSGKYLTTDGKSLSWGTVAGGMTLISEQVTNAATSLSFTSIAGTYKQLYLIWSGVFTSDNSDFALRFNNDSGSNYAEAIDGSSGSTYSSSVAANASAFTLVSNVTSTNLQSRAMGFILIDNYASTTRAKTFTARRSYDRANIIVNYYVGCYNSTSAITSLDIVRTGGTGTFSNATNTSFRLYGIS